MTKDQGHFTVERMRFRGIYTKHSDPLRDEPLGQCPNEVKVDPPEALMYVGEPTWKGIERSGSAPVLNGIPYIVYELPYVTEKVVMAVFPYNLEERDKTGMLERD